jgi:hypothetical protein
MMQGSLYACFTSSKILIPISEQAFSIGKPGNPKKDRHFRIKIIHKLNLKKIFGNQQLQFCMPDELMLSLIHFKKV